MTEEVECVVRVGATKKSLEVAGYAGCMQASRLLLEVMNQEDDSALQTLNDELARIGDGMKIIISDPTPGVLEMVIGMDCEDISSNEQNEPRYDLVFKWFEMERFLSAELHRRR